MRRGDYRERRYRLFRRSVGMTATQWFVFSGLITASIVGLLLDQLAGIAPLGIVAPLCGLAAVLFMTLVGDWPGRWRAPQRRQR